MHSELNLGYLLHDRERERDEHVEHGLRLSALRNNDGSSNGTHSARRPVSNGLLSWPRNLLRLLHGSQATAEAA
jgi:hypothetical protein